MRGLAITGLVVAACGKGGGGRPAETVVEARLREAIGAAVGEPVTKVTCATPVGCVATIAGVDVEVALRESAGSAAAGSAAKLAWSVDGLVLRAAALEAEVAAMLDDLGVAATIDCGPRVRVIAAGDKVACELGGAVAGRAWMRIDAAGEVSAPEIVFGADEVKARTQQLPRTTLEALSNGLDRGEFSEQGEGPESGSGAGAGTGTASGSGAGSSP